MKIILSLIDNLSNPILLTSTLLGTYTIYVTQRPLEIFTASEIDLFCDEASN